MKIPTAIAALSLMFFGSAGFCSTTVLGQGTTVFQNTFFGDCLSRDNYCNLYGDAGDRGISTVIIPAGFRIISITQEYTQFVQGPGIDIESPYGGLMIFENEWYFSVVGEGIVDFDDYNSAGSVTPKTNLLDPSTIEEYNKILPGAEFDIDFAAITFEEGSRGFLATIRHEFVLDRVAAVPIPASVGFLGGASLLLGGIGLARRKRENEIPLI